MQPYDFEIVFQKLDEHKASDPGAHQAIALALSTAEAEEMRGIDELRRLSLAYSDPPPVLFTRS